MRISRVQINNYRNLQNVDINLSSISTLIGENNSGKSNLLRAISLPLLSDSGSTKKHLSWSDINNDAKQKYFDFLKENRQGIIDGSMPQEDFVSNLPVVLIRLDIEAGVTEHYDIKDLLCETDAGFVGSIQYLFYPLKQDEIIARVRSVLNTEIKSEDIKMSLLPIELYAYSITVPDSGKSISYEVLNRFRSVDLPAERDNFASNADKLGSTALADVLKKNLTPIAQVGIEKKYADFFATVKDAAKMETILNWQYYTDVPNAKEFFNEISVMPNMPPMSSILGSIRLGYDGENMYLQGLGHRNLILMAVMLNSYLAKEKDISLRVITVEEPEAHLCNSNVHLMISLFNVFSKKSSYTQIIYSTHNAEFVNKVGLDSVIVLHKGTAFNLGTELTSKEKDYLAANPNTDIFKLFFSRKVILVEGITEELLIKTYLQLREDLNDIKVFSFHKGFKKIVHIWKKLNAGSGNKLGVIRDYDEQPNAQEDHEQEQNDRVIMCTTTQYTLEPEIVSAGNNYDNLKEKYGIEYGWSDLSADELSDDWRRNKSDVMLRICHDMISGELQDFSMPQHIQRVIDFLQNDT